MTSSQKTMLWLFVSLLALPAMGGGLLTPFTQESASVLPGGVGNVRVLGFTTEVYEQYNNSWDAEPLASAFTRQVTWNDLIAGQPAETRGILRGYLLAHPQLNPNSIVGETTGEVISRATVSIPTLAFGINNKWTMAISIPIIYTKTSVDTGFVSSPQLQAALNTILPEDNKLRQANEIANQLNNPIADSIVTAGYEPLVDSEEKTEMGDVKISSRYEMLKTKNIGLLFSQTLTLPTGRQPDVNKLIDVGSGDGQVDLGLGTNMSVYMTHDLTATFSLKYTWQFPDATAKRIPQMGGGILTPDVDPSVQRDLGDIFSSSLGLKYNLVDGLTLGTSFAYQEKIEDVYEGTLYQRERYSLLSRNTDQSMQALQMALGYSTIPLFRQKQFAIPLDTRLSATRILAGRNVKKDDVIGFDFSVYF